MRDGIEVIGGKHIVKNVDKLAYVKGVYTKGTELIRIGKRRFVEINFI